MRPAQRLLQLLDDDTSQDGAGAPREVSPRQARSFVLQLLAQIASKCADTLGSSRVVLPWLLSSIGAPTLFIAWLVPIRESLSLIPQLAVAANLRKRAIRKNVYVWGAILQGICVLAMPLSLALPSPSMSAAAILLALAGFSVARSLCSVASKDVLGKTVAKGRRGKLSGLASSVAGVFTLCFGTGLLMFGGASSLPLLAAMLCIAGGLWIVAAVLYGQVPEQAGDTDDKTFGFEGILESALLLKTDKTLRLFVIARMLLVSTAYAIPFLVVIVFASAEGNNQALALVILAEGLAALTSGFIWGIYADRSAHRVLAAAGLLTAATLAAVLVAPSFAALFDALFDAMFAPTMLTPSTAGLAGALALYVAAIAHQGTRLGRKTYIVDLANEDNRAAYVAISNTVIGIFVMLGGTLGWVAQTAGTESVLMILMAMAVVGAGVSWTLRPV